MSVSALRFFSCLSLLALVGAVAQEPVVKKKVVLKPEAVVKAYLLALEASNLKALGKTYTRPLQIVCDSLASFQAEHRKLVQASKKLFGAKGPAAVDHKRYHVTLPPFSGGTVGVGTIHRGRATVPVKLRIRGKKELFATHAVLKQERGEWRIVEIGDKPLPIPQRPEAIVAEWEVATEATRRTLNFLSRNKVRKVEDLVSLRKSYLKIITKERTLARKLTESSSKKKPEQKKPAPKEDILKR